MPTAPRGRGRERSSRPLQARSLQISPDTMIMRQAACATSVGEEMKIGLSASARPHRPSAGAADRPTIRAPSLPTNRNSSNISAPRMACSCAIVAHRRRDCGMPALVMGSVTPTLRVRIVAFRRHDRSMQVRPPSSKRRSIRSRNAGRHQSGGHEDRHAEQHLVGLQRIARRGDEVADTGGRGRELADDHAEERASGAVLEAGEDERDGARQHDRVENLDFDALKLRATRRKRLARSRRHRC